MQQLHKKRLVIVPGIVERSLFCAFMMVLYALVIMDVLLL